MRIFKILLLTTGISVSHFSQAQVHASIVSTPQPGQVVISGTVADEASKAAVIGRLHEVYGPQMIVDQIAIGAVVVPPNWNQHVQNLITPNLKLIKNGQVKIDGNAVRVQGEVANEVQRQEIASSIATSLNPTYTVTNGLRVAAAEQSILDDALANRTISFEPNRATLTPAGRAILDEISEALTKVRGRKVEVVGHTDNSGLASRNISLSRERAEVVKAYLADRGFDPADINASGRGPDQPIASNDTAEGRAKNRRIEFRLVQ